MIRGTRLLLSLALLAGALSSCATVSRYYDYASEPDPRKQEFTLGAADALKISVWKNPELSADAIVRPDGTISLPLVGEIAAGGRTPRELQIAIAQRLTAFVKDESASVTVAVVGVNSYRFVVVGNVEHGGTFTSTHYTTLTEAMAMAGGPTRFAEPEQIVIIRPDRHARHAANPHQLSGDPERNAAGTERGADLGRHGLRPLSL